MFPPYTGGCIVKGRVVFCWSQVSSLYGRVYRLRICEVFLLFCFLPIREGVSANSFRASVGLPFPPYTGGCIVINDERRKNYIVSSLYGRVYRKGCKMHKNRWSFLPIREGVSLFQRRLVPYTQFPPYTGGCIDTIKSSFENKIVSSLYGRVYHWFLNPPEPLVCFLPIREGVSEKETFLRLLYQFPPYTGGCIARTKVHNMQNRVSSLYGRVYHVMCGIKP